jgi:DNA (cytosine-5)-methyltransferase 1
MKGHEKMRHGSLFSGIGGFDLAAEWMGWENVFHCEWNDFGKRVLNYYWPKSISYDDITKTDFTIHRGDIDILTGGFPCQPYSAAGKRLGKEDDRHLWPEMLRAIREIAPTYVVGENVYGLVNWNGGLVFDEVQSDLEDLGYQVQPVILPACAVNAPHRRDRVWFVAYSDNTSGRPQQHTGVDSGEWVFQNGESKREQVFSEFINDSESGTTTDTYKCATRSPGESGCTKSNRSGDNDEPKERGKQAEQCVRCSDVLWDTANTQCQRPSRKEHRQTQSGQFTQKDTGRRWQDFPTQSPICSRNDGISTGLDGITFPKWRNESIKAYGNAIVPKVAFEIFKVIGQLKC